jgi:hypothetical protein
MAIVLSILLAGCAAHRPRPARVAEWIGGGLAIGGTVMMIGGAAEYTGCGDGDCQGSSGFSTNKTIGVALLATGGALILGGGVLWIMMMRALRTPPMPIVTTH